MKFWAMGLFLLPIAVDVSAQSACPKAPVLGQPDGENIFDKQQEFTFDSEVEHAQFSADGSRLAVLTRKQDIYFIDVAVPVQRPSR